jgi:hypothetical protein
LYDNLKSAVLQRRGDAIRFARRIHGAQHLASKFGKRRAGLAARRHFAMKAN